ncbi:MAG: radical SAM family heme chaperone HemW [Flavobacteriales bacterium]
MAGIYLHVPFCKQKCSYCDFHFSTSMKLKKDMVKAMVAELEMHANEWENELIETVYFGGGTPSILDGGELKELLEAVKKNYRVLEKAEVTIEANPDDIDPFALKEWKSIGINRLSIGLQSFQSDQLVWMNRAHTAEEALKCIPLAQEHGFDNISVDLIYGLPGMSLKSWEEQLKIIASLNVQHLSCYILTVEEKTLLHKQVTNKEKIIPHDELISAQYTLLCKWAKMHGFEHYEVSNFAQEGKRSEHNGNYWKRKAYLGIGPSAHGFKGKQRNWNIANNPRYIKQLQNGEPAFDFEQLTERDVVNEEIMVGLRKKEGIDPKLILRESKKEQDEINASLARFTEKGWLKITPEAITMTESGWLMSDAVSAELFS